MALVRENKYGKIKVSNKVMAQLIRASMEEAQFRNCIWPGGPKNKAQDALFFIDDFHNEVFVTDDEQGRISIRFPVTVKFGYSISQVTWELSENICRRVDRMLNQPVKKVTIEVRGIKSKNLSKREVEVIKEYEYN